MTDTIRALNELRRQMIAIVDLLGRLHGWLASEDADSVPKLIAQARSEIEELEEHAGIMLQQIEGCPLPQTANFLLRLLNDLENLESPTGRVASAYRIEKRLQRGEFSDVQPLLNRWEYDAVMPAVVRELTTANVVADPFPGLTAQEVGDRLGVDPKSARRYAGAAGVELPADFIGAMRIVRYIEKTEKRVDPTAKRNARKLLESSGHDGTVNH